MSWSHTTTSSHRPDEVQLVLGKGNVLLLPVGEPVHIDGVPVLGKRQVSSLTMLELGMSASPCISMLHLIPPRAPSWPAQSW
jgi:hypothetical protein